MSDEFGLGGGGSFRRCLKNWGLERLSVLPAAGAVMAVLLERPLKLAAQLFRPGQMELVLGCEGRLSMPAKAYPPGCGPFWAQQSANRRIVAFDHHVLAMPVRRRRGSEDKGETRSLPAQAGERH